MLDSSAVFFRAARGMQVDRSPNLTDEIDNSIRNLKRRIAYAEQVRSAVTNPAANRGTRSALPEFVGDWSAIRMASAIGALPSAGGTTRGMEQLIRLVTEANATLRKINTTGIPIRYTD